MRRILLAALVILLCGVGLYAQDEYKQTGTAVHTLDTAGLVVAHPAERLGSRITLINLDTKKEVEVTVRSRPSPPLGMGVIVNVSEDAWKALGLRDSTRVAIKNPAAAPAPVVAAASPPPPPPPEPAAPPPPPPPPAPVAAPPPPPPPPAPVAAPPPPPPPPAPVAAPPPPPAPAPAPAAEVPWHLIVVMPPTYAPSAQPSPPPPPPPPPQYQPPPPPPPPPPVYYPRRGAIEVIPGYPNPNSGRAYHLQVGSFTAELSSIQLANEMTRAGFNVVREVYRDPRYTGPLHRVVIPNVPAAQALAIIQRLEQFGIKQVWVRE